MNFNERPWAELGDASENDVFTAVGRALSHWELVEGAVASLFTVVTVGNYHAPASPTLRAFASVVGSANRIRMVEAALASWLLSWPECPVASNASSLLKECSGWAGRRNDIAHGLVDRFIDEFEAGWFLIPSLYTLRGRVLTNSSPPSQRITSKSEYRYNSAIINAFSERFLEIYNRANETTSALGEWHRIADAHLQNSNQ